ncbi:MAG TPA: glutamine-hydrolyzing carbamoyl-phosphate synthase small subunit [Rectinema sp.]|jgi:carbamoyl-phosphate synthase small subunit|nr:glutamine-hydrolyzing carbamoyl-phosphate synthase small subunit [Treponema sp.]HOC27627.1 glutamine-hydrolyzing carbamoyl-phosphate synthase small subunit [Rectinema sp.]HOE98973.1 glutamine-hydrolyzing carbamoyl-phosphate synthase small subunit [Rectinema sp.]HOO02075.1 glutamine-hydrolyzing carbamoyl-phosphate synthase small subunit [Rectinema sp.]HPD69501.1 glutamine-hydrolyzing carbamoyl-phosphate synthase small subunit [Rectinema sp.]
MSVHFKSACLVLEDGSTFEGYSIGADISAEGEVVFSTGMVGYNQSLTDPSYCGQILVFAYPLIGNHGVPRMRKNAFGIPIDFESEKIQVSAVVIAEACSEPSHYSAERSFSKWLNDENVPGIAGIDTRRLIRTLREEGVMHGKILIEGTPQPIRDEFKVGNPVRLVSPSSPKRYIPENYQLTDRSSTKKWEKYGSVENSSKMSKRPTIALVDCGAKANILRILLDAGSEVIRLPWDYPLDHIEYDGLLLSNGPGDPKACTRTIAHIRHALMESKPIFGICLGTQLLALASGADTYKLKYGHRGQNQPVIETKSRRCYITSQNHGYAICEDSLPTGWEPWFVNGNDETIEGIRASKAPFRAVQFHPEGCPGPRDTQFLIQEFLQEVAVASSKTRYES